MYKSIFFVCFLFFNTIILSAQNLSVYGLSLGDSKDRAINVLNNKGKQLNYGKTDDGFEYIKITNPQIGGTYYDGSTIYFKNNKLYKIVFYSGDGGACGPDSPWLNTFRHITEKCKQTFTKMNYNLKMKYGKPNVDSENLAIWQIDTQKITIEYEYKYNENFYSVNASVWTGITYEKIDFNSLDY